MCLLLGSVQLKIKVVWRSSLHNKRHLMIRSSTGTLIWFNPVFSPLQRRACIDNDLVFLYHILYTACLQNRLQPKYWTTQLFVSRLVTTLVIISPEQPASPLLNGWDSEQASKPESKGHHHSAPRAASDYCQCLVSEGRSALWMLGCLQCFCVHKVDVWVQHRPAENAQQFNA